MRKSLFNRAAGILAAVLVLFTVSAFTSCTITVDDGYTAENLNGTWTASAYEYYKIDTTTATFDNGYYAGDNMTIEFEGEDYGTIYFKYTKSYESTTTDPEDDSWTYSSYTSSWYRYSTTAPDVGKWYAVSFKNLTSTSVDLSGAYGTVSSTDSLDEAKETFTVDNGYFSYYSSLTLSE